MIKLAKAANPAQAKKVIKPSVEKTEKVVTKKAAHAELEDTNKKVVLQKVISHRELKYIYPKDCKDTLARKTYRQKVRNHIRLLGREIDKLKGDERKALKETLEAYKVEHLF